MKELISFVVKAFPFTAGLILSLTALSFLVSFSDSVRLSRFGDEDFITFVVLFIVGIPTLLFGMQKLSNESVAHPTA